MHSKTFIAVLALATAVIAAPLLNSGDIWGVDPSTGSLTGILGSALGNGNGDGSSNGVGSSNGNNGNSDGNGDGNKNGDGNSFGNGNNIGIGDSGLLIGRHGDSQSGDDWLGETVTGILGSALGNGNGDGSGNAVGYGNDGNGNRNGQNDGNGDGDGDNGIKIGRKVRKSETLGTYVGNIIDDVTVPLEPRSSDSVLGSVLGNGNGDGSSNSVGLGNSDNGNGSGSNDGNDNGSNNELGNSNSIGSSDCVVRDLPPNSGALIPEQTVDEFDEDFSNLITIVPGSIQKAAEGVITGVNDQKARRQVVLTGLGDIIADDIAA